MNILVFLSKTTGFECLKWLLSAHPDDSYTIFISDPDKVLIADYLIQRKIPFHDLALIDPVRQTEGKAYDWLVNIWGSYIFRTDILSRVENSVNLHPSYLPYGRGRDPVVWAIRDGVPAGATMHKITEGIDAGDIWVQVKVPYVFPETGGDLYKKVEKACIGLFCENWTKLRKNELTAVPQGKPDLPTRRRKDLLEDRIIGIKDAEDVVEKLLAHDFKDNNYTALLENDGKTYSVTLNLEKLDDR